jgi:hypothetical protein
MVFKMSLLKTMKVIFGVLGIVLTIIFVNMLWSKVINWIGDGMWTFIIVGILLLIFVLAGVLSKEKIKNIFGG